METPRFTQVRHTGPGAALVQRSLPDFGPVFRAYANDLKREAERVSS